MRPHSLRHRCRTGYTAPKLVCACRRSQPAITARRMTPWAMPVSGGTHTNHNPKAR